VTKEIINYLDRTDYKADPRHGVKRPLSQSFIRKKIRVIWVDGSDDPDNNPRPAKRQLTQKELLEELAKERGIELL